MVTKIAKKNEWMSTHRLKNLWHTFTTVFLTSHIKNNSSTLNVLTSKSSPIFKLIGTHLLRKENFWPQEKDLDPHKCLNL